LARRTTKMRRTAKMMWNSALPRRTQRRRSRSGGAREKESPGAN